MSEAILISLVVVQWVCLIGLITYLHRKASPMTIDDLSTKADTLQAEVMALQAQIAQLKSTQINQATVDAVGAKLDTTIATATLVP